MKLHCALLLLSSLIASASIAGGPTLSVQDLMKLETNINFIISPRGDYVVQQYYASMSERTQVRDPSGLFRMIRLMRIDEHGKPERVRLERLSSADGGILGVLPFFSPKGKRLAFARPADAGDGGWVISVLDLKTSELIDLPFRAHRYHTGSYPNAEWVSEDVLIYVADPEGELGIAYGMSSGLAAVEHAKKRWTVESGMTEPAVTTFPKKQSEGGGSKCLPGRAIVYDLRKREHRVIHQTELRAIQALGDGRHVVALEPCELEKQRPMVTNRDAQFHLGLVLVDTISGSVSRPCGECNLKYNSLTVAPHGRAVAFLAYDDSGVAIDARLMEYNVDRHQLRRFNTTGVLMDSVDPRVDFNLPGHIVWLGDALAVHGTRLPSGAAEAIVPTLLSESSPRRDWYRVTHDDSPVALTEGLNDFGDVPIAADGRSFVVPVGESLQRFSGSGSSSRVAQLEGARELRHARMFSPHLSPFMQWEPSSTARLHRAEGSDSSVYLWNGKLEWMGRVSGSVLEASESGSVLITEQKLRGRSRYLIHTRAGVRKPLRTRELLALNEHLEALWPNSQSVAFSGPDGIAHSACLYLPADQNSQQSLPLIVDVYPAPLSKERRCKSQYGMMDYTPLLAARGYAVLSMWLPVGIRNPADRSFNDTSQWVLAATEEAAKAANIDTQRMGLYGVSQGGFAVPELVTRTNRFKAAVAGISDVDYLSLGYGQNLGHVLDTEVALGGGGQSRYVDTGQFLWMGSYPWEEPEAWVNTMPMFRANKIETPLFLWTNEFDAFSTRSFFQLYNVLTQLGRDVQLDYYYNEGHGHDRPANFAHHYTRLFEWFDKHLKPNTD